MDFNKVSEKKFSCFSAVGSEGRNWIRWKQGECGGGGEGGAGENVCAFEFLCDSISSKRTAPCDKYNFTEEVASDKRFVRGGKVLIRHIVAERTQP